MALLWGASRQSPPQADIRGGGLLPRFLELGLVDGFHEMAVTGKPALFTSVLAVPSGTGLGPVSVGLVWARDLSVNVVLPFLHASEEIRQDSLEAEAHLETYGRFGKLQDNELTRKMSGQLMAPSWQKVVKNARRQQGLLHLKHLISGLA